MKSLKQVHLVDARRGRLVIAERVGEDMEFWEQDFGGVRWYRFNATPDIRKQAEALIGQGLETAVSDTAGPPS